ncbi:uncharacterized protein Z520_08517 [Fonsecaea multimorphosa CBS 102226]|uniref:SMP-30/Gluconolactonase/LRE-like region domain-containing protein n=1 Tax=Fonsecaea multimorphosa CBS 102226 TaxID=1442371 RepID=A0A0D2JZ25_9EURO|nr:uncharacterized protein Z520_08517 [Fonsecaea multimorphosa CBS 102226]KIX95809.1 hypothetical protein Z520_08517 [Fonsecaea multimorphosa CBS 102226]OAL21545.1 hypothetical protein AYO22_07941 [Fonsecaea multimorphosa]
MAYDLFYLVAGNFSTKTFSSTPGTYAVRELDLRGLPAVPKAPLKIGGPALRKVVDIPHSGFLNGLAVLNPVEGVLLISDSLYGVVWSVNVNTGATAIAINDTSMDPLPNEAAPLGINGLHVVEDELFYTNSNQQTFNKVRVDTKTGRATGPVETIVNSTAIAPDDFTIDFEGNVWIADNLFNELSLVKGGATLESTGESKPALVSGSLNSTTIAGHTSAAFGVSSDDV